MGIKAIDLRRGHAVKYKDGVWVAVDNKKVEKGKGSSYYSIQLKNIRTGQLITERFRPVEDFEQVHVDRKSMEYLYSDGSSHIVMDNESYEQMNLPAEMLGDQAVYLTPNIPLEITFIEGNAISIELPNTVELTVTDTPPQVKGATATNQPKDAVCDGGAKVKVVPPGRFAHRAPPPFSSKLRGS